MGSWLLNLFSQGENKYVSNLEFFETMHKVKEYHYLLLGSDKKPFEIEVKRKFCCCEIDIFNKFLSNGGFSISANADALGIRFS